jgi:hypothetical protein
MTMPTRTNAFAPEKQASTHMANSIRHAFCTAVNASGLPPMAVLELAAMALGAIYKEAATAHHGTNGCPCGWHPDQDADLEALRIALGIAATAAAESAMDLRLLAPMGRG